MSWATDIDGDFALPNAVVEGKGISHSNNNAVIDLDFI